MPPKVLVATPAYAGQLTTNYTTSLLKCIGGLNGRLEMSVQFLASESLITRARNYFAAAFLADETLTHLLFIDSDIGFEPQAVFDLVQSGLDVVGCAYPMKVTSIANIKHALIKYPDATEEEIKKKSSVFVWNPRPNAPPTSSKDFIEVNAAGTGFLCISKDAVKRMAEAFPELKYSNDVSGYASVDATTYALFDTMVHEGRFLSEDFAFCERYRSIGGKIFLCVNHLLTHTGPNTFSGRLSYQLS